jgi:glycosyltransferase involved in cell wall biosynthesis
MRYGLEFLRLKKIMNDEFVRIEKFPLISVNITTYNRQKLLLNCLKSVQRQSYPNIEIIVVNDNSSDNTEDVVNRIAIKDQRIKLISHEINCGNAFSRNTGIKNCRGTYIAFLDDDDEWIDQNKLLNQYQSLNKEDSYNQKKISCTNVVIEKRNSDNQIAEPLDQSNLHQKVLSGGVVHNSTVLVYKSIFEEIGYFDIKLKSGVDSEFIRRALILYDYKLDYLDYVSCKYSEIDGKRMTNIISIHDYDRKISSQILNLIKYNVHYFKYPKSLLIRFKIILFHTLLYIYK